MAVTASSASPSAPPEPLAETVAPASPAGPLDPGELPLRPPPERPNTRFFGTIRFVADPLGNSLDSLRRFGDVWQIDLLSQKQKIVATCHPDHVKSLFKASPDDAPSITGQSPLRPIMGPNSVLTLIGPKHMRQRKLLLPPFHGDAITRYVSMIEEAARREIDRWQVGRPFALAPRMQAITLDVIMSGVFGIGVQPVRGTAEHRLRQTVRQMLKASTNPLYALVELQNAGRIEPRGILKAALQLADRHFYAVIRARRAAGVDDSQHDVLSLLLQARDEDGRPMTDEELRDELITLLLAGHETTANSLAWTFERLLRTPAPYDRLRELVRSEDPQAEAYVEATVHEGMRVRPVIPMIGRIIQRPWQLGDYVVPAKIPVAINIAALHHREDVYPDPFRFAPERFLNHKPGTYTWIPFGGGIRRCLGASLAMAEQRVVLTEIARRVDLEAVRPRPEKARQRNVTMIPGRGGRVLVTHKHAA